MRWIIGAITGLVIGLVAGPGAARACDRARSPLEAPTVGVAVADLAVVGEVTALAGDLATVKIERVYKGAAAVGDALQIRGVTPRSDSLRECGVRGLATGDRKVFLVWQPAGALAEHRLIDPMGGVDDVDPKTDQKYKDAIAAAHPRSAWALAGGVQAQLVVDAPTAGSSEIDLVVIVRNVGARARSWRYRSWPPAAQSRCTLTITNQATGVGIAPRAVPITKPDIRAYFAKHGPRYDATMAPGDVQLFRLDRVTTAAPGWGYKERLGFTYYPVVTPGAHTVAATCHNLLGRRSKVATGALTLAL